MVNDDEREFLERSLADLDRELAAGDLDPVDAATLRADYERRLALLDAPVEAVPAPRSRPGRTIAVVAAVVVLAVGAGIAASQTLGSRAPGRSITGAIRESSADRLQQAAIYQEGGKVLEALKLYDRILRDDPRNAEALAERGFLLLRLGAQTGRQDFLSQGQTYVGKALALEPKNPRWLVYKAMGLRVSGDAAGAEAAVEAALANDPPPALRTIIEQIRGG